MVMGYCTDINKIDANPIEIKIFTLSIKHQINPIAFRMAKTLWSFGHSECNRVKNHYRYDHTKELPHEKWCIMLVGLAKVRMSLRSLIGAFAVPTDCVDLIILQVRNEGCN